MATDYKTLKEAFVSNLTGSTVWEVNKVTLVAPVGYTDGIYLLTN